MTFTYLFIFVKHLYELVLLSDKNYNTLTLTDSKVHLNKY